FFSVAFFSLSFLVASSLTAFSQQNRLSGSVIDKSDATALPGASIVVYPGKYGDVSKPDGTYSINLQSDAKMVVASYLGMKSDTFFLQKFIDGAPLNHVFKLSVMAKDIDAVVVSSTRYGQPVRESTVSMQTLSAKQLEDRNTVNIKAAMELVPGLTVLDEEPQIRGGSGFSFGVGSRVATIVDGLPLLTGDAGRTEWSFIPTESIGRVEVLQGASSVLYGSSALSGTINFLTKMPEDSIHTTVRSFLGTYRTPENRNAKWWGGLFAPFAGVSFVHGGVKEEDSFLIGGMVNYDHGYIGPYVPDPSLPFAADTLDNADVAERTGRLNFTYTKKLKRFMFGLSGNAMAGHNNFSLVWGDGEDRIYRAYPGSITTNDFLMFYVDPSISYVSGNGIKYQMRSRFYFTDNNNSNGQANQALTSMMDANGTGMLGNSGVNFTAGVFAMQTDSRAALYASGGSPNNQSRNRALYLQVDRKFFDKLIVQVGGRVEYYKINDEDADLQPVFRGGLNYEPFKGTNIRASYGQGYRYPTITEKFINTSAGGITVFPNPDVDPESSNAAELGIRQGLKLGKWLSYVDVAAFQQLYYNTIEYIFAAWKPGASGFKFVNTGNTQIKGLEITCMSGGKLWRKLEATFFGSWTMIDPQTRQPQKVIGITEPEDGFIAEELTYLHTSTDTSNLQLKYRFRHLAKADVEFRYGALMVGGSCRYYSFMENIDKAFYDFDMQSNPNYPDGVIKYREEHTKGTIIWDLRLGYQMSTSWSLNIVANNIANLEYSLRPMKIESPGTVSLQIVWKKSDK
ncbi:MAG: TonB-dependent receptor domain-containing protein, partial [Bacteroidota bacterium]